MSDDPDKAQVLARLYATIAARRGADPSSSYTASLFAGGTEKIAAKVMEEAHEAVEEARNADPARLAAESADLIYHLMVMWAEQDVRPEDVWEELARREGTSGHAEKAARKRD